MLDLDYLIINNPQNRINFCEEILDNIQDRTELTYTNLAESITKATSNILVKPKLHPGWFQASEKDLSLITEARNEAMRNVLWITTCLNKKRLQQTCKKLKAAVRNVKNNWIQLQCHNRNTKYDIKQAWDTIKLFRKTLAKIKQLSFKQMKCSNGTICNTPEENVEVFQPHFQTLFDTEVIYDESVLEQFPQYHIHCDYRPTDKEIRTATCKLKNNAPGEAGIILQD